MNKIRYHSLTLIPHGCNKMDLPDYETLAEVLERSNAVVSPAEVHGMACGLLIKDAATPPEKLKQMVLGEMDQGDILGKEAAQQIETLFATTKEMLQDPELGFAILTPDEDEPLDARVLAARDWARGVVYGLAELGVQPGDCPTETADFLTDCKTLAETEYATDVGDDAGNEGIYFELLEFLRMGTLMAQEELQPLRAAPRMH